MLVESTDTLAKPTVPTSSTPSTLRITLRLVQSRRLEGMLRRAVSSNTINSPFSFSRYSRFPEPNPSPRAAIKRINTVIKATTMLNSRNRPRLRQISLKAKCMAVDMSIAPFCRLYSTPKTSLLQREAAGT